jgi:hypothetical protein
MADSIVLNDAQIRGLISGAVDREHSAASIVAKAKGGGALQPVKPTDKPTPSQTKYKALEALWAPVLKQVYAMPAAQVLKGVLPDPQIGTTRIANTTNTKGVA